MKTLNDLHFLLKSVNHGMKTSLLSFLCLLLFLRHHPVPPEGHWEVGQLPGPDGWGLATLPASSSWIAIPCVWPQGGQACSTGDCWKPLHPFTSTNQNWWLPAQIRLSPCPTAVLWVKKRRGRDLGRSAWDWIYPAMDRPQLCRHRVYLRESWRPTAFREGLPWSNLWRRRRRGPWRSVWQLIVIICYWICQSFGKFV